MTAPLKVICITQTKVFLTDVWFPSSVSLRASLSLLHGHCVTVLRHEALWLLTMGLKITGIVKALEQGASLWHLCSAKYNVGVLSVAKVPQIQVKVPEKSRFQQHQAPAASISTMGQRGTNYCHAWNALVTQWGEQKGSRVIEGNRKHIGTPRSCLQQLHNNKCSASRAALICDLWTTRKALSC